MFNMGDDTSLSTSSPSPNSLRPCILAIRGWLRPRELPLWSLKPPYYPEKTLVSSLSAISNLGTLSWSVPWLHSGSIPVCPVKSAPSQIGSSQIGPKSNRPKKGKSYRPKKIKIKKE
jgi:hypothetical protein